MKAAEKSVNQATAKNLFAVRKSTCRIQFRFEHAIARFPKFSCNGQAHWPDLQSRLHLLLLP
jgi:hypothetical protein